MARAETKPVHPVAERIGRYEMVHKLASGGMGEVYLARSVGAAGFQKHVVIKKLLPHLVEQPQFVEGLIREAKLLVALDHPNIVQVLDLGVEGSDYFMAMEYVHGYNLATIIHYCAQNQMVIPLPACAVTALHVLAGLEYAHGLTAPTGEKQNIIHRDVSPQNVLISTEGRVKLTDFGIAKVVNEAEGEFTQSLKGKFRYMAPEVVDGGRIDQRYDLFAVGIILFEALCRRHLFAGSNDLNILAQVRKALVPPVARYHPGVNPELVRVVEHALAKEPDDRFQTANEFALALRAAMAPTTEPEALNQLRGFVSDIYGRSDFPINKPKLPDLSAPITKSVTRSIQLRSRLEELEGRPRRGLTVTLAAAIIFVLGAAAFVAYGFLNRPKDDGPGPGTTFVVVGQKADSRTARPADGPAVAVQSPDVGRKKVALPPAKPFDPVIGADTFRKQGGKLTTCFHTHSKPDEAEVSLKVVSVISAAGTVKEARVEPTALAGTPLGRCIVKVASRIRYPRHDKATITFLQPVTLTRATPP
jgi:serine/threonine protein kinase